MPALREEAYAEGAAGFAALVKEPTFRDFVCLYIAEGYKRSRNTVSLGNSDAAVILLADRWIRRFSRNPVTYKVQYHADQRFDALAAYWGGQLRVPADTIRFQRKSNSGQLETRTWRSKYGVLTVDAHDTMFRARLEAWMDCLRDDWVLDSSADGV